MKILKEGNWSGDAKCPVCGTNKKGQVVLIPIAGTEEGSIMKAIQVHLGCIDLTYYKHFGGSTESIIEQIFENKGGN